MDALLAGGRLALGNPDHVPAGIYARQALEALGLWPGVKDRLAPAADVRAALALVARGEAPSGIVYATDALLVPDVRVVAEVPASLHEPIVYPAALITGRRVFAGGELLRIPDRAGRPGRIRPRRLYRRLRPWR